jgi:hypothetical protein
MSSEDLKLGTGNPRGGSFILADVSNKLVPSKQKILCSGATASSQESGNWDRKSHMWRFSSKQTRNAGRRMEPHSLKKMKIHTLLRCHIVISRSESWDRKSHEWQTHHSSNLKWL